MHPVDKHKQAVAYANEKTLAHYGAHGPYKPGTPEHAYWLARYDARLKALYS